MSSNKKTSTYSTDNSIDTIDFSSFWEGKIFQKRYILIKEIDQGGYASVWICLDTTNMKYYAMKITNSEKINVGKRETHIYKLFSKYKSDNIMKLLNSFDQEEEFGVFHCCVMDLMACSTYNLIKSDEYDEGLNFDIVIKIFYQTLKGLSYLHNDNIIHGDIKPENLLISGNSCFQNDFFKFIDAESIVKDIDLQIKMQNIKNSSGKHAKKTNKRKNISNNNTTEPPRLEKIANRIKEKISEYKSIHLSESDSSDCSNDLSNSDDELDDELDDESNDSVYCSSDASAYCIDISTCSSDSSDSADYVDSVDLDDLSNKKLLSTDILDNMCVKISDMGGCLIPNEPKSKQLQTSYYKAPEVLLGLGCTTKCDLWSLGCTIYELLTGNILFDPDEFDGNFKRHHLYLMVTKLGMFSESLISMSPKRDIYFTADNKLIKGYKTINMSNNLFSELETVMNLQSVDKNVAANFIDLIKKIMCFDPSQRIDTNDALNHQLFKNMQLFNSI